MSIRKKTGHFALHSTGQKDTEGYSTLMRTYSSVQLQV